MIQVAEVFKLNHEGLNVRRALGVLVVMLVPRPAPRRPIPARR